MKKWSIPSKVYQYIYQDKKDKALALLSEITALNQGGLFEELDESYLRYVGEFRIQLMMDWGYYREALAWACLECELYPDNTSAFIFKENLKQKIRNLPKGIEAPTKKLSDDWGDIAGMRDLKNIIERDIIIPFTNKELYRKYKIPLPNGYIFYGPPGCGKTYFASKLAKKINYNFIKITPSDIGSTYVHGTQLEIGRVFEEAKKKAPALLFFDEFESIAPKRTASDVSHHYKSEVNELLTKIEGVSKSGVLFIAATNHLKSIDSAILRPGRIDKRIFIGPPDYEARIEAYKMYLKDRPIKEIKYEFISESSEFFTFADIEEVCNEAARLAFSKKLPISTDILGKVVNNYQPDLNDDIIKGYL